MENTLENKIVFMAQYYGQHIVSNGFLKSTGIKTYVNDKSMLIDNYLELTPLHLISDEDLEYIALKLSGVTKPEWANKSDKMKEQLRQVVIEEYNSSLEISDYLRSKSYAIKYNGLSVEEQVERGWVVLRTDI